MSELLEQARQHFLAGVAHMEAARLSEAEACFEAALALAPDRPSVLTNLGSTRVALQRWKEALPVLHRATELEPDNLDAWIGLGVAHAALGQPTQALASLDRVLALDATLAPAWSQRGHLLRELQRLPEAAACYKKALALGAEPIEHNYYLAAVQGAQTPPLAPRAYVENLFDHYAHAFSQHLVAQLGYRAHETLIEHLPVNLPLSAAQRFKSVLDLGCGTGLCAPLVKPRASRLVGVDLSAGMLAQARALGLYDDLFHADVIEHLDQTNAQHDLVLAADVFIYVGALDRVFAAMPRVLLPGGCLAFSVELPHDGSDLQLMPSLRYAHSRAYVEGLAAAHGLRVLHLHEGPLRADQGQPVAGLFAYLQLA